MPDFDVNINAALLANRLAREAASAASATSAPPATAPAPVANDSSQLIAPTAPAAPPASQEPVPQDRAVPDSTQNQPVAPEPQQSTPPADTTGADTGEGESWDAGLPITPSSSDSTSIDLKKIGRALNLEVNNEEELVSKINEQISQSKALLERAPDALKKALEIAEKGGDWVAYTNAVAFDATKLDPIDLFQREYERTNAARFVENGVVNREKLYEEMDTIQEGQKILIGNQIKSQIVQRQQQQQAAILAQAAEQQQRFQKSLAEAAKELPNILPKEKFVPLKPQHISYIYEGIANGSLVSKHLGDIDPGLLVKMDGKKLMRVIALSEFGERITAHQRKQGEVAGKKSILAKATNPQLQSPSYVPRPNEPAPPAPPTSTDLLRKQLEKTKPKGSL